MKKELEISVDITPVPQKRPRVTRFGTYDPQKADKEAFKELVVVPEDHIPFDKAIHEIESNKDKQFDPYIASVFISHFCVQ